jgi:hypothetical protein
MRMHEERGVALLWKRRALLLIGKGRKRKRRWEGVTSNNPLLLH